jgi:hypothetical protein
MWHIAMPVAEAVDSIRSSHCAAPESMPSRNAVNVTSWLQAAVQDCI